MIRKTDETPPRIYVINVGARITGKNHDAATQDFRRMTKRYPDVSANCTDLSFAGRGQKHVVHCLFIVCAGPAPMRGHAVYRLWAITRGAECFCRLAARYPEVNANCVYYKFPGRRQIPGKSKSVCGRVASRACSRLFESLVETWRAISHGPSSIQCRVHVSDQLV